MPLVVRRLIPIQSRWKAENVSTFEVGNAMMEFAPLQEANV
jgi:hypothetical protein